MELLGHEAARDGLRALIRAHGLLVGRVFRLKAGYDSAVYLDLRAVFGRPEAKRLLASLVLPRLPALGIAAVGGVVAGGVPLSEAVSTLSPLAGPPIPSFYVRPKPKDHGLGRLIDGTFEAGQRCLLMEDVVTTAGSALAACDAVHEAGGTVALTLCVVDRSFGRAAASFAAAGAAFEALFTLADFVDGAVLAEEAARATARPAA